MKYILPAVILFFVLPSTVFASNLWVSDKSDFSSDVRNFSSGQTVYVRVETDNLGDSQKVLNVRDNDYKLLTSYTLSKSGNTFSANFPAPSGEGYYSLEAKIESNGQNATSVKTIKVGSFPGANVKVNVSNKVEGRSTSSKQAQGSSVEDKGNEGDEGSSNAQESPQVSPSPEADGNQDEQRGETKSFWDSFRHFLAGVLDFVLPF